jgi:hypothetical protein
MIHYSQGGYEAVIAGQGRGGGALMVVVWDGEEQLLYPHALNADEPFHATVRDAGDLLRFACTEWKCDYPHDSLVAFKIRAQTDGINGEHF